MENSIDLKKKYGIDIDTEIYKTAFTHSSYSRDLSSKGETAETYQRLEFMGDKVLDFVITEILYRYFEGEEGALSQVLANFVCSKAHVEYSRRLGLVKYLRVGPKQYDALSKNEKILADLYEAFIGATYFSYGIDKVREIVNDITLPEIINFEISKYLKDYKTEIMFCYGIGELRYEVENEEINKENHVEFTSVVKNSANEILGRGKGLKLKDSEQMAAKDAIEKIKREMGEDAFKQGASIVLRDRPLTFDIDKEKSNAKDAKFSIFKIFSKIINKQ